MLRFKVEKKNNLPDTWPKEFTLTDITRNINAINSNNSKVENSNTMQKNSNKQSNIAPAFDKEIFNYIYDFENKFFEWQKTEGEGKYPLELIELDLLAKFRTCYRAGALHALQGLPNSQEECENYSFDSLNEVSETDEMWRQMSFDYNEE